MTESPLVLFVCVHNAGRSQMAAEIRDEIERRVGALFEDLVGPG
jgi:protein-tyrosine-phosphatase